MKQSARHTNTVCRKAGFVKTFQKNLPLTIMALPALMVMFLFRYLPMSGLLLAFKRFSVPKGIFGSDWVAWQNFEFLFKTSDAWVITRNTILYNAFFIALDLVMAVAMAIGLSELLRKRRAKVYQTIFMAPYFLSWVVVSFMAFSLFSVDDGLFNHLLNYFGFSGVNWYAEPGKWPFILTFFQLWKTVGYSTVMYISTLTGISNDYYEAAIIDGATKWQQIRRITLPCLKPMMIVLTILAIGRIFYADFGLFFQLPRDSGPLYPVTQVIDTYVYRALKETGNVGMAAADSEYLVFLDSDDALRPGALQAALDAQRAAPNDFVRKGAKNRENSCQEMLEKNKDFFQPLGVDIEALYAVLISGIYYLVLRKDVSTFCNIDFSAKAGKERMFCLIDKLSELLFAGLELLEEKRRIAVRLLEKGMEVREIAEILEVGEAFVDSLSSVICSFANKG